MTTTDDLGEWTICGDDDGAGVGERSGVPVIYVISDSVGETAELVARAALTQFAGAQADIRRIPHVKSEKDFLWAVDVAAKQNGLVAFTLVFPEMRRILIDACRDRGVAWVDILGPMMDALATVTAMTPKLQPGLVRQLDEEYFRRVEAVEFAVKYDDGKDPRGLLAADVVIIGVSRTSKTPVCMYLAHQRVKAANIPLVPEVPPPAELSRLPRGRVVGLTIRPDQLNHIRQERLRTIGLGPTADYANPERIRRELEYAGELMRALGCPVIDVTSKAIEETAARVMDVIRPHLTISQGGS
jgi:regulator of PEP synthase PpsR (kinase-PPPase family)